MTILYGYGTAKLINKALASTIKVFQYKKSVPFYTTVHSRKHIQLVKSTIDI